MHNVEPSSCCREEKVRQRKGRMVDHSWEATAFSCTKHARRIQIQKSYSMKSTHTIVHSPPIGGDKVRLTALEHLKQESILSKLSHGKLYEAGGTLAQGVGTSKPAIGNPLSKMQAT